MGSALSAQNQWNDMEEIPWGKDRSVTRENFTWAKANIPHPGYFLLGGPE